MDLKTVNKTWSQDPFAGKLTLFRAGGSETPSDRGWAYLTRGTKDLGTGTTNVKALGEEQKWPRKRTY